MVDRSGATACDRESSQAALCPIPDTSGTSLAFSSQNQAKYTTQTGRSPLFVCYLFVFLFALFGDRPEATYFVGCRNVVTTFFRCSDYVFQMQ